MKNLSTLFLLLIIGCNYSPKHSSLDKSGGVPVINVAENLDTNISSCFMLSEAATDVDFIKLEVTTNSMIRDIRNVVIAEDYVLVDDYSEGVFRFSKGGKFLNKIGKKGNGPDEYLYVNQVILNEKNNEVLLFTGRGIKIYTIEGSYKRSLPNTNMEDLFSGIENRILFFDDYLFLNDKLPVLFPKKDLWTFALVDSTFTIQEKYFNPAIAGKELDIIANKALHIGWKNYWNEGFASVDFYDNTFKMCYYGGDTIYEFNKNTKEFLPVYIISLGERPSFEISHQWIKDPIFFNYLWFSNFYDSETYLYLFLGKSDNSYIIRYDKTNGELRSYKSESLIKEINLPGSPNFIIRNRTNSFALINDISGGNPFEVEYKSSNGKYWVDVITSSDLKENINIADLKRQSVKNENSKAQLVNLINESTEEDNPILLISKLK